MFESLSLEQPVLPQPVGTFSVFNYSLEWPPIPPLSITYLCFGPCLQLLSPTTCNPTRLPDWSYHFAVDLHCVNIVLGELYDIPQPENLNPPQKNRVPWVQLGADTTLEMEVGSDFLNHQFSSKRFSCCGYSSFPPHPTTTFPADVTALESSQIAHLKAGGCNECCWDNRENKSWIPTSHLTAI